MHSSEGWQSKQHDTCTWAWPQLCDHRTNAVTSPELCESRETHMWNRKSECYYAHLMQSILMRIDLSQQEQVNPPLGKPLVPLKDVTGFLWSLPPCSIAWRTELKSFEMDKPQAIKSSQWLYNYYYWLRFMIRETELKEFNDFALFFKIRRQ